MRWHVAPTCGVPRESGVSVEHRAETPLDHELRRRQTSWNLHLLQPRHYQSRRRGEESRGGDLKTRAGKVGDERLTGGPPGPGRGGAPRPAEACRGPRRPAEARPRRVSDATPCPRGILEG